MREDEGRRRYAKAGREGQDLTLLIVGIILVAKNYSAISQLDQSSVRDGDAMRVACQILQDAPSKGLSSTVA